MNLSTLKNNFNHRAEHMSLISQPPVSDCILQGSSQLILIMSLVKWKSLTCVRFCDPMDYIVHGVLQVRILEWVAVPFSRASSQLRDRTQVFCIVGRFFTSWATREARLNVVREVTIISISRNEKLSRGKAKYALHGHVTRYRWSKIQRQSNLRACCCCCC